MQKPASGEVLPSISQFLNELGVPAPAAESAASTRLFEGGLNLDSFTVVELLGRIEAHFGMAFHDDDFAPEHLTLGALASIVDARLAELA